MGFKDSLPEDEILGMCPTSPSYFLTAILIAPLMNPFTKLRPIKPIKTLCSHPLFFLHFLFAICYLGSQDAASQFTSPSKINAGFQRFLAPFASLKNRVVRLASRFPSSDELLSTSTYNTQRLDNHLTNRDVTVQLFQWKYSDVAKECEEFLGPIGYRYVQISPPHEHIEGPQWWTDYQPVSYRIGSKRGTEAEFDEMVERCGAAGVGVIVDVVMNHMSAGSNADTRYGTMGSPYQKYNYPNLYRRGNFHQCRRRGSLEITNYTDRYEVQYCELVGLADLKTSQRHVQNQIKEYLQRLISKGAAGFRIDAAKHIPAKDLQKILENVSIRVVQEVMFASGEPIRPEEYMSSGRVHIFQAAYDLKRMFLTDGIAYLGQPVPWGEKWGNGYLASSHSQVFVTNWDLERNENALRIDQDPATYLLCQIFILTWDYGQVDVFSGYNFSHYDHGPQESTVECGRNGWRCEHRHPLITGAVRIRAASSGQPVRNIITHGAQRLAFTRGSQAFVALNNEDTPWTLDGVVVGMPIPPSDKPYRNILQQSGEGEIIDLREDSSIGFTVLSSVIIPPRSAIGFMV